MAYVNPITNKQHLLIAEQHIKDNNDPAFHLIWRIGCETGFRVTDITQMKYENFDFDTRQVTISENKGTKARIARSRLKVLQQVKNELIGINVAEPQKMMKIFITKDKDIYDLIPEAMRPLVDARIAAAAAQCKPKTRTAKLSNRTIEMIKARMVRYSAIDDGSLFARSTLRSHRAKNISGVVSRQSCWAVFSKLTGLLNDLGEKIRVGCHSMRKIFSRFLYESSGKDIGLLMRTIGHSSPAMSLIYIGISQEEELNAQDNMFSYLAS